MGQKDATSKPNVKAWLAQQMASDGLDGAEEDDKASSSESRDVASGKSTRVPFTPQKASDELVPETPNSKQGPNEMGQSSGGYLSAATTKFSIGESKRRRVVESSDEEGATNSHIVLNGPSHATPNQGSHSPSRSKAKRARLIRDSSDEDVVVVEEAGLGEKTVEIVDDGDEESDGDDDADDDLDPSASDLLSKCEEVSEDLKKQVQTAVVEQPKCVGSDELKLKKYQLVGLNWLINLHKQEVNGILADEMGLGKTIQCVAFLGHLQSTGVAGPHLIISPASTLENWKRELNTWLPSASVVVYHGSQKERELIRRSVREEEEPDVFLTTYSYFQTESAKLDRAFLRRFEFECMFLDEGHAMKNSDASRSRRLMSLTYKWCILLTGTPINNNLPELLALLQFLMPSFFEGEEVEELQESCSRVDKDIKKQSNETTKKRLIDRVRLLMNPFILRRRKVDVLCELVPKTESVHLIDLPREQRRIYNDVLDGWKKGRTSQRGSKDMRAINSLFTELRKVANHPLLVRSKIKDSDLQVIGKELLRREHFGEKCTLEMIIKEIQGFSDFDISKVCASYKALSRFVLSHSEIAKSGKFEKLKELLNEADKDGHRVLVFSQWTNMLDIIEEFLTHLKISYLRLDGSTAVSERQSLIDEYNRDSNILVFLLSTRAGGLGINLTSADTVILHDLDFNPQSDRQAEDRCHRIGQQRPVRIHRLVSKETVDENIFQIADRKRKLADQTLGESEEGAGDADDSPAEKASIQHIIESCLARYLEDED